MPDQANVQRILDYLRQYRAQYELEVLRQQLLDSGYRADDVAEAMSRLQASETPPVVPVMPETASATVQLEADFTPTEPRTSEPERPEVPAVDANAALQASERERAVAQMVDYLRQHGTTYEPDALRRQLLASGQDPQSVEEAFARAQISGPPKESATWPLGLVVMLINLFLVSPLAAGFGAGIGSFDSDVGALFAGLLPLLIWLGELIGGIVLLRGPRRRLGKILLWGVLFTVAVPIILGVLALGICLVILAGIAASNP